MISHTRQETTAACIDSLQFNDGEFVVYGGGDFLVFCRDVFLAAVFWGRVQEGG